MGVRVHHGRAPGAGRNEAPCARLRLIATSDLHMQILPYDYVADRETPGRGLALAAAEAARARAEAQNALFFDVGDAFQGGPIDEALAEAGAGAHPMAQALDAAGIDAVTLGNHDFNFGLPALERAVGGLRAPAVLCNIVRRLGATPQQDETLLPPFVLLDRTLACDDGRSRPIRIGVTGVAPPQTLDWDADKLAGRLAARDAVAAVAARVPEMHAAGAEVIVVLAHTGVGAAEARPGMEHAAVPIAGLDGVDAVLAGHAHRLFPAPDFRVSPGAEGAVDPVAGTLHGTPAAMPGFWGRHLALVDLKLEQPNGRWRVASGASALRQVTAAAPLPEVVQAVAPYHRQALSLSRRPVARAAVRLHTYFGLLADTAAVRLVNAAQREAVRAARPEIAAAEGSVPLLAAAAPLKGGGLQGPDHYTDVPPGPILARHLADLYTYPNTLQIVPITGAELRLWLERSASVFATVAPGATDSLLLDPAHAAYSFDIVHGATYRIALDRPPRFDAQGRPDTAGEGRIVDLRVGGRIVAPEDRFVLATNGYRLGSETGFPDLRHRAEPVGGGLTCREALARHLAAGGAERPLPLPAWGFVPMPGTTALYPAGPGARDATPPGGGPDAAGDPAVRRTGAMAHGFDLYRVDLARADLLAGPAADGDSLPLAN